MKKIFFLLNIGILVIIFGVVFSLNYVFAWTEPISVPPQNNVPAPINVGKDAQIKIGTLGLLGENPSDLYGLSLANGKTASIKSINKTTLGTVEINNLTSGVFVNANKKLFSGIRSEVKGSGSIAGYFANNDLIGQGLFSLAVDTGAIIKGGNIGAYIESDNMGMVVKNDDFESNFSYTSPLIRFAKPAGTGIYSKVTAMGRKNLGIYPIALVAEYDTLNYAELGQNGVGVLAKGAKYAGVFQGNVSVTGKLSVTGGCSGCAADLAEDVAKLEDVQGGDIVAMKDLKVLKATKYDKTVVGVVSSQPFLTLSQKENGAPLALSGIVPVNVSNENGAILAGDFITASSVPGVGMKATEPGTVIGKALEDFNGKTGKIQLMVSLSYFPGLNCQK